MNQQTQTPMQETISWLRTQVEQTVLSLKQAKRSKNLEQINFLQSRLEDLGRRILHVDVEIDKSISAVA